MDEGTSTIKAVTVNGKYGKNMMDPTARETINNMHKKKFITKKGMSTILVTKVILNGLIEPLNIAIIPVIIAAIQISKATKPIPAATYMKLPVMVEIS